MDRILNEDRTSSSSAKTTKADQLQQLAISDKTFQITQAKAALVQYECSIRNEVLLSFLRRAQLFNIEKRYASADEAYIALKIEDQKRLKNVHFEGAIPSSFRQKWNDPTLLIAEQSSGAPPTKKLNALSALAKLQQHTKAATKEIAAIKGTIAAAEELKMPEVPSNLVHYGASIPTTITQEIRQGMHDLQFLFSEVTDLQEKLLVQSDAIKTTFFVWISGGTDCWNYGKTRVHELESLRKYEYDRNSLLASCYVVSLLLGDYSHS